MQDLFGGSLWGKPKKRKPFKISTKKKEWMSAARKSKFTKTSKCRNCGRRLSWGDGTYHFDHKDNNEANNSQKNCYLVCRNCHGKVTVTKKRKIREPLTGAVIGHKTIKKKVGYKKVRKKRRKKRKERAPFDWL